jgi:hypothetical protein
MLISSRINQFESSENFIAHETRSTQHIKLKVSGQAWQRATSVQCKGMWGARACDSTQVVFKASPLKEGLPRWQENIIKV